MTEEEQPPTWSTASFMENVLRKAFKDDGFKIVECSMASATAVGDHFNSQMHRLEITSQNREKMSLVVKSAPVNVFAAISPLLFEKEITAYSEVLPSIESLLKEAFPGCDSISARCYYYLRSPYVLILEDLGPGGYVLGDRYGSLDVDHASLVLTTMAKFHAASLKVRETQPEKIEKHRCNFWNRKNEKILTNILKYPFLGFLKDLKDWPNFDRKEEYLKKLTALEDDFLERIFKVWDEDDTQLNVLLHGDSWVNNFMFRYEPDGRVSGIKVVDFQILGFNSPVVDLLYFIYSSVKPELKFEKIDSLLDIYMETFTQTVNKLGISLQVPFGPEDLRREVNKKAFWGFAVLCCIYPMVTATKEEMFDPKDYFCNEGDLNFSKIYKRESLRKVLIKGLQYFEAKGLF